MNKFVTTLAVATLLGAAAISTAPTAGAVNHHYSKIRPAATGGVPEYTPLDQFGSDVQSLGESDAYADTFAGAEISGGRLKIYLVPNDRGVFLDAVNKIAPPGVKYTVIDVSMSYAKQLSESEWVTSNLATLAAEGMSLESWGPSPADDAVLVTLVAPSSAQLARMQRVVDGFGHDRGARRPLALPSRTVVTRGNYRKLALALLAAQSPFPDDVVVSGTTVPTLPTALSG